MSGLKWFLVFGVIAVVLVSLSGVEAAHDTRPPRVTATSPANGAEGVDPGLSSISVTFDEPMKDGSWSWCYEDPASFPQTTGQPHWEDGGTRNVLPVRLQPHTTYIIWINTAKFTGFQDRAGNPAAPFRFTFRTR